MAKTRAQRKAERRRREQAQQQQGGSDQQQEESKAQRDTQAPVSGDVAEAEAVIETGARTEDYGEHVGEPDAPESTQARAAVPGVTPEPVTPEQAPDQSTELESPAPSRADVGQPPAEAPGETREQRRARKKAEKQAEKEQRRRERTRELQKAQAEKAEKRRGGVIGFFQSCWAELKKVQWPDRDTLVQASAVTLIFVAVMAAYLGALDGAFNWLIKQII
jgi:preprotein translocase SecE subunit